MAVLANTGTNVRVQINNETPKLLSLATSGGRCIYQRDAQPANHRIRPIKVMRNGLAVKSLATMPSQGNSPATTATAMNLRGGREGTRSAEMVIVLAFWRFGAQLGNFVDGGLEAGGVFYV